MSSREAVLAFGCALLVLSGCTFDRSGINPGRVVDVPMNVMRCPSVVQPLSVVLSSPSGHSPQANNYDVAPGLWQDKGKVYPLYIDQGSPVISDIGYPNLKGTLQIRTSMADAGSTLARFLDVTLNSDTSGFYLAYDSRAVPPDWLSPSASNPRFEMVVDGTTTKPYDIATTLIDATSPASEMVRLRLWRLKTPPKASETVHLPGNDFGGPGWGNVPQGNRAMYIVLIAPAQALDCSHGEKLSSAWWEECVPASEGEDVNRVIDKGIATAVPWCIDRHSPWTCVPTTVFKEGQTYPSAGPWEVRCQVTITGSALIQTGPRGFDIDSEIAFEPATSHATVKVQGKQYTTAVSGKLYFDYLLKTHDIRVNDIRLQLEPMTTDVGKFSGITAALAAFSTAHCRDSLLVYNQPCSAYRISQGEFVTGETYDLDGVTSFIGSTNQQDIDIKIDHPTRTFHIAGGPLSSSVKVGGNDVPVDIALDLRGRFVNFAPVAVGTESNRYRECSENRNGWPVLLSAAGSFDVYDQLPANPTTYVWYEDYGLITEKLWGQGKTLTIGPHQLGFGVHQFTLVVRDKNGVAGTTPVEVTIGDSKPPTFGVPPDVLIVQPAASVAPQKVDIGKAWASDVCSPTVIITNDARSDLVFEPGVTPVTWSADDRRGHLVKRVQKVSLETEPLEKAGIRGHLRTLAGIVKQVQTSLRDCEGLDACPLDLTPLRRSLDGFAESSRRQSEVGDWRTLVSTLERARVAAAEIDKTLAQSNANANRRARARGTAIRRAIELADLLEREANRNR